MPSSFNSNSQSSLSNAFSAGVASIGDAGFRRRMRIANLEEDPLPRLAASAHEHTFPLHLLPVQNEVQLPLFEFPLPFIFFETHVHAGLYNSGMGRLRIKKKEAVIPFRETLAYRMILITSSVIAIIVALYVMIGALRTSIPVSIASGVIGITAGIALFYNLDLLRTARVPKQTLNRMKRR